MRLRGRIAYKLLTLALVCGVVVVICLNYFSNEEDDFLLHLPPSLEELETASVAAALFAAAQPVSLPSRGEMQLLNLTDFQYTLPNDLCQRHKKELLAILIVTSYAGHDDLRSAHRQAIAQSKLAEMGLQRVFLLATLPAHERFITQAQLADEQQRFGDLLQGNFVEAYRNLSYKHMMGLHWASNECAHAKFIIKMDDDIVYDIFHLRRYLESLEVSQPALATSPALLAGYVLDKQKPLRNVANKWYVNVAEFAPSKYPAYLSGWLYITNSATAKRLVLKAHQVPIFWIDDTWVTGILRDILSIPMQRLNDWYSANAGYLDCCVHDLKQANYECEYFVGPNDGDSKLLVEFLHNVEKCYFDECVKRPPEKALNRTCVVSVKPFLPPHGIAQVESVRLH